MRMKKKQKKPSEKVSKRISKKKILMASIATIASAAVIVGTLLPSAQEVVSPNQIADPPAIVLNLEEDAISEKEDYASETKKSNRFADRLRNRLLSLPQAVRVIFVLPLWALGWVITAFGSLIWGGVFSPALGFIASWLLSVAVFVGLFALTAKLLFPNIPFKKILTKKNIYPLIGVAFLVVSLDAILPFYMEGYNVFSAFIKIAVPSGIVGLLIYRLKKIRTGNAAYTEL